MKGTSPHTIPAFPAFSIVSTLPGPRSQFVQEHQPARSRSSAGPFNIPPCRHRYLMNVAAMHAVQHRRSEDAHMKSSTRTAAVLLLLAFGTEGAGVASTGSNEAAYVGGTVSAFSDAKNRV